MANFMYVLLTILETCPNNGENFLVSAFLEPNYEYFKYSYTFDNNGNIIRKTDRHYTGRNQNETERYKRIAIEAVYDYNEKDNRNTKHNLNSEELEILKSLCADIEQGKSIDSCKKELINLIEKIEKGIIDLL